MLMLVSFIIMIMDFYDYDNDDVVTDDDDDDDDDNYDDGGGRYWGVEGDVVSVWLAVDDADVENGCMYVIPSK